jgi:tyrosinase
MQNVWSSINDPLFWMHHAQVDHVWAIWQGLSPGNAVQVNGPIYPNGTGEVSVDSPLLMEPNIAPDSTIGAVLDTKNNDGTGILCYEFEETGNHPLPPVTR